jgi:hypothetical protein
MRDCEVKAAPLSTLPPTQVRPQTTCQPLGDRIISRLWLLADVLVGANGRDCTTPQRTSSSESNAYGIADALTIRLLCFMSRITPLDFL